MAIPGTGDTLAAGALFNAGAAIPGLKALPGTTLNAFLNDENKAVEVATP